MTQAVQNGPGDSGAVPSLTCGPLHALGARLGLVDRDAGHSIALGLAIAAVLWGVLMVLAVLGGNLDNILSLSVIGGHVRLLITIPLMFVCETWFGFHVPLFIKGLDQSRLVRDKSGEMLQREVARLHRLFGSVSAEVICLALALAPLFLHIELALPGNSTLSRQAATLPAGQWYWFVCLPVFRFLVFRWIWRLGVWTFFLWRLSRLDLQLIPTHPDRSAGLGYLSLVQSAFAILVAAIAAVVSASLAEEIAVTGAELKQFYGLMLLLLLGVLVVFTGPLCFFARKLAVARARGLAEYMDLASGYVRDFDKKWLRGGATDEDQLLGTADLQSLADLSNSVRVVEDMRVIPINLSAVTQLGAGALVPMLPLLLFQFPALELAERVLRMLVGG